MPIQLDKQAQALIANVQHQTGPLPEVVDQAIATAAQAAGDEPLTLEQALKAIQDALPDVDQAAQIKKALDSAKQGALSHHCDGTHSDFFTQIFNLRVEKEIHDVWRTPPQRRPVRRDPLYASFNMAPDADFLLLFNASDVDRNGKPLLMKVVARESADLSKLDLAQYRTMDGAAKDVVRVGDRDDVVEIKDINEEEFQFGTPLKFTAVGAKGEELSTGVEITRDNKQVTKFFQGKRVGTSLVPDTTRPVRGRDQVQQGENLDRHPVKTFDDRIRLSLEAKDGTPSDQWLEGRATGYTVNLTVEKGLMFEPNTEATVTFAGRNVKTAIAADDAEMLGSPLVKVENIPTGNMTLAQLLGQQVQRLSYSKDANGRAKPDQNRVNLRASDLVYGLKEHVQLGGNVLNPLGTTPVKQANFADMKINAEKLPIHGDADGQLVKVTLGTGFAQAKDPASVDGWRMVVGYTDAKGAWHNCGEQNIKGAKSKKQTFDVKVEDTDQVHKRNGSFEVRVYNDNGIPAQRFSVPFKEVDWSASARSGHGPRQD